MKICITGGAGYVGSALVPTLLHAGHDVTVLDTFWFGDHLGEHERLTKIRGDIRFPAILDHAFRGQDAVIHLACVSNDPSFDMNPDLGKSINYSCFKDILFALKENSVARFIYASSSSVYGVSNLRRVVETSPKKPLTDYSKFKLACEADLRKFGTRGCWTIIRPATVCGYSPRQRLDLVVNIFTAQALVNGRITVHGGLQTRPNINIEDMVRAYKHVLDAPTELVDKKIFNVGGRNLPLHQIARQVMHVTGGMMWRADVVDKRSYRIDSKKIEREIGFRPNLTIQDAAFSIKLAYQDKRLTNLLENPEYYNIKKMKELSLS